MYFLIDGTEQHGYEYHFRTWVDWTEDPEQASAFLVFGGDGAMLNAINRFHALNKPFIGIHAGTRGYLMNNTDDPRAFYRHLDEVKIHRLWMLEGQIFTDHTQYNVFGFNDIWVERRTGQTLRMKMTVDGIKQPPVLVGDGILFCTPQGSTGYNLALRGKAVAPGVPVLQVTPMSCVVNKAPLGSIILSDQSIIEVQFLQKEKRPGGVIYDGFRREDEPVNRIVVRKSRHEVELGLVERYSFIHKVLSWQLNF